MTQTANYFERIGWKRILLMVIGNIFIGAGISIFKLSVLGNDPFSAMVMSLSANAGMSYANFLVLTGWLRHVGLRLWPGSGSSFL